MYDWLLSFLLNFKRLFVIILLLTFPTMVMKVQSQGNVIVHALIQGYYIGGGSMTPALHNQLAGGVNDVDWVTVQAHQVGNFGNPIAQFNAVIDRNGIANGNLNLLPGSYYFSIHSRNALRVCTAYPIAWGGFLNLDFADPNNVYSSIYNLYDAGGGNFCLYSGDVNDDGYIDTSDVTFVDNDNLDGKFYDVNPPILGTDVNGDGYVDTADVTITDNNNLNGIQGIYPP